METGIRHSVNKASRTAVCDTQPINRDGDYQVTIITARHRPTTPGSV